MRVIDLLFRNFKPSLIFELSFYENKTTDIFQVNTECS